MRRTLSPHTSAMRWATYRLLPVAEKQKIKSIPPSVQVDRLKGVNGAGQKTDPAFSAAQDERRRQQRADQTHDHILHTVRDAGIRDVLQIQLDEHGEQIFRDLSQSGQRDCAEQRKQGRDDAIPAGQTALRTSSVFFIFHTNSCA